MTERMPAYGLDDQGISTKATINWNLTTGPLVEEAIQRGEGKLAKSGPLVVKTGKHTGRSAKDKFIVKDSVSEGAVWFGKTNVPMSEEHFAALKEDFLAAVADKAVKELAYQRQYAAQWVLRLGDGTDHSHARMQAGLEAVWPFVEGNRLKPAMDKCFPLDEAARAHARMEAGEHVGKIVLTL